MSHRLSSFLVLGLIGLGISLPAAAYVKPNLTPPKNIEFPGWDTTSGGAGTSTEIPDGPEWWELAEIFGLNGKFTTNFSAFGSERKVYVAGMTADSAGNIVIAGSEQRSDGSKTCLLARFDKSGNPDLSVGPLGKFVQPQIAPYTTCETYNAVVLGPEGQIIAVGRDVKTSAFVVVRYKSNGTPDTAFNGTGMATTSFDRPEAEANAVVVQGDKIVVTGYVTNREQSKKEFVVARFTAGGNLDNAFGTGGALIIPPPLYDTKQYMQAVATAVALQPDNKIVAAGSMRTGSNHLTDVVLVRLTADGVLDDTFASDHGGMTITEGGSSTGSLPTIQAIAVQSDGNIVMAGWEHVMEDRFLLGQFNKSGVPLGGTYFRDDPLAGSGFIGPLSTRVNMTRAYAMALQDDDKILLAGSAGNDSHAFSLARFLPDARRIDPDFNDGNAILTKFGNADDHEYARGLSLKEGESIAVVGYSEAGASSTVAIASYSKKYVSGHASPALPAPALGHSLIKK